VATITDVLSFITEEDQPRCATFHEPASRGGVVVFYAMEPEYLDQGYWVHFLWERTAEQLDAVCLELTGTEQP
jgi:hypothetical protein